MLTPVRLANRPGLRAINYRVATHAAFLKTMKARLSGLYLDIPTGEFDEQSGQAKTTRSYPLHKLKTREASDPAIALLDAWATIGDVLTFYQERIANEGYLRTARERRSLVELARLVNYRPRPGVSASVYLAYTLEEKSEPVEIPAGTRSQSVPGPGEAPQVFETSEVLEARVKWNLLKPRRSQPQTLQRIAANERLTLKGITTNLKENDRLLVVETAVPMLLRIAAVQIDATNDRTILTVLPDASSAAPKPKAPPPLASLRKIFSALDVPPAAQPANALQVRRDFAAQFAPASDNNLKLLRAFHPAWQEALTPALENSQVTPPSELKVYALRVVASLFGHNTAKRVRVNRETGAVEVLGEWEIIRQIQGQPTTHTEFANQVFLDAAYDKILPGSWIVVDTSGVGDENFKHRIQRAGSAKLITRVKEVKAGVSRAEYGLNGKTTHITVADDWLKITIIDPSPPGIALPPENMLPIAGQPTSPDTASNAAAFLPSSQPIVDQEFQIVRRTQVYAQSEELELAEELLETSVCGDDEFIELDALYDGLQAGRWVILAGERDIEGTAGVPAGELAMLAEVLHGVRQIEVPDPSSGNTTAIKRVNMPGDRRHTFIKLARKLAYCYRRDSLKIYGNVVKATNGETRNEVLGSGDASQSFQAFALKQPPLTYVAAPTVEGIASTLAVRVNDLTWREVETLAGRAADERVFITKTDDDGKTTVVFGDGRQGARLPSGVENLSAAYRNGIGKGGNVRAAQISLPITKPLGVKEVINPLRASGGADKESRDLIRRNAPLAVMALDRLLSTQDYADFARTFAGIGKAAAARLTDGRRQFLHLTIAGVDDIPIDEDSDLFRNLRLALSEFGDPQLPVQIGVRELLALGVSANVQLLADYQWEKVEPRIRAALLDTFAFDNRELGQAAFLSEAIHAVQNVAGVAYVDVDVFTATSDEMLIDRLAAPEEMDKAETDKAETGKKEADAAADSGGRMGIGIQLPPALPRPAPPNIAQPQQVIAARLARIEGGTGGAVKPAQLAVLTPQVAETLILNERKEAKR